MTGNMTKVSRTLVRIVRIRFIFVLGCAFLLFLSFQFFVNVMKQQPFNIEETQRTDGGVQQACRHPDLDMINPLILKHIRDLGDLNCKQEPDWVQIHGGSIIVNQDTVKIHGWINCAISYFVRADEFSNKWEKVVRLTSEIGKVPVQGDFFHVICNSKDRHTWKSMMATVYRNETAVKRAKSIRPPENAIKLNVLMFGLDSMSRMHYMRKLPKTYKFLTNVLKAVILKGYNIVGDGTPQAMIPILTGQTELELPETRKRMPGANFVNVYPFVWKNFTASGYVTVYGEDGPSTGTFNYRLKGFSELPTDHYMRSFYIEADKVLKDHPNLCFANKPRHTVMLDYLKYFTEVYAEVPKFAFLFHSELSHDDYNLVGYADSDIEKLLKYLHEGGMLNNTLLILMSDHGHRFANIRETQQGKQEERLPFFSLTVPPWFHKKYPEFVKNLQTNANRLVTPFDIHATFMTLLHPENVPKKGDISSRSISLFSEIPQERTCSMAGVEPHWCACLSWTKVSMDDPIANEVGEALIDFINMLTEPQRSLCEPLLLQEVTRIERLQPNKALLKFKKNADKDGFVGEFTDNTELTEIIYQVQIRAFPSNAIYEASVKQDVGKKVFLLKESEISRVNMYGNQGHCVHATFPNLRKYCFCKVQL